MPRTHPIPHCRRPRPGPAACPDCHHQYPAPPASAGSTCQWSRFSRVTAPLEHRHSAAPINVRDLATLTEGNDRHARLDHATGRKHSVGARGHSLLNTDGEPSARLWHENPAWGPSPVGGERPTGGKNRGIERESDSVSVVEAHSAPPRGERGGVLELCPPRCLGKSGAHIVTHTLLVNEVRPGIARAFPTRPRGTKLFEVHRACTPLKSGGF